MIPQEFTETDMKRYTYRTFSILAAALILFCGCDPDKKKEEHIPLGAGTISGTVTYSDGKAAAGITVSDGYTCTVTDKDGKYSLKCAGGAFYIFYSNPSDAKVEINESGLPCFFKRISKSTTDYDFKLTRIEKENKFRMLAIGDIQPNSTAHVDRFKNETVADIRSYIPTLDKSYPTYAIQLGDLVNNKWELYPNIIREISRESMGGIPVYSVIGNHDHEFPSANNLAAQRKYEGLVSPVNYSFNRGDVHFLVMDDIIHTAEASPNYDDGFLDWQVEWAKQDLANVPKDKVVILCVHAPFESKFSQTYFSGTHYYDEMLALLASYKAAYVFAGHTHTSLTDLNHTVGGKTIHEYVVGAACGGQWNGTIGSDGAPNGYSVFEFDGTQIKNSIFKGSQMDESKQMRIYRCTDFPQFDYVSGTYKETFSWGLENTTTRAVINIWNYNANWRIDVYEDGIKTVSQYSGTNFSNFGYKALRDMWAKYFFYDYCKVSYNGFAGTNRHCFWYTMKNPSTNDIKVVATDEYGHTFQCEGFTTRSDKSCISY